MTENTANINWNQTLNKIEKIINQHKSRRLSLLGRKNIINALILPHILQVAAIFYPRQSTINQIENKIFKFLWYPQIIEPQARKQLIAPYNKGGLQIPDIEMKCATTYLISMTTTIQEDNYENSFFIQWARYNMGTLVKQINPNIYSNSIPHRPKPNETWKKRWDILQKYNLLAYKMHATTSKELYRTLLEQKCTQSDIKDDQDQPIPWTNILLKIKNCNFFTLAEQSLSYKVAHKAFICGSFYDKKKLYKTKSNEIRKVKCKLCSTERDTINHVLLQCKTTNIIRKYIIDTIKEETNTQLSNLQRAIMYNLLPNDMPKINIIRKLLTIYREEIIQLKENQDKSNKYITNTNRKMQETLWKIKCKFKIIKNQATSQEKKKPSTSRNQDLDKIIPRSPTKRNK
ncbi:unnamed protein product [Clavelina lepadiformis]|uniref:Reverse transcriptase zinc-binding domain-containing protein n=1 Tax=Clavelina lepadiformis TaxID=159417 RepID=A0ABP0GXE3_CLALP